MKKILLGGVLCMLMNVSCTEQPIKEDFITDCEKSGYVKTPRFAESLLTHLMQKTALCSYAAGICCIDNTERISAHFLFSFCCSFCSEDIFHFKERNCKLCKESCCRNSNNCCKGNAIHCKEAKNCSKCCENCQCACEIYFILSCHNHHHLQPLQLLVVPLIK